jgi:hypothetical protein
LEVKAIGLHVVSEAAKSATRIDHQNFALRGQDGIGNCLKVTAQTRLMEQPRFGSQKVTLCAHAQTRAPPSSFGALFRGLMTAIML